MSIVGNSSDAKTSDVGRVRPIFVLGRHRSGTTWVTNILAEHPDAFTPTHVRHNGQHESAFFTSLMPYCSFGKTKQDRQAIRAIFECSDYWHLLFPDNPPAIDSGGGDPYGYFRRCMDEAAQRRNCTHWIEKTPAHTLATGKLIQKYPDAYFVFVDRGREGVNRSNVYKFSNPEKVFAWIKAALWTELYKKIMHRYQDRLVTIRYEDLLASTEEVSAGLYTSVGLSVPAEEVHSRWKADSSFSADKRPESPPLFARISMKFVVWGFRLMPSAFCESMAQIWLRWRNQSLPEWFFRVFDGRFGGSGKVN